MAANSESAGEAGLSASAAGAGTGGKAYPLDHARAIFTKLGMTITQWDGMINSYNLMSMYDFYYIRVDDAKSFVKVWNEISQEVATKVGIPAQRKLQVLLYWYQYQRKRGLIPESADFDVTAMRLAVDEFDAEKAGKELDIMDLDPGKIEMDLKCWPFKETFLNMANNVMEVNNNPLYGVIRPDHTAGWVPPNDFEQQM